MRSYDLEKEFLHKDNCGKGIIYNLEDGKFDVTVELNSSNITEHLLKVTYDELVDLKALSLLLPGVFYRITDYEFTSTDPEVISAGHRFDIIVLALSENILSEDARAIQHEFTDEEKLIYAEEEQHYFDKSNLSAWKLKYSLDGDSKRFDWAPENKNYGIIVNIQSLGSRTLYRNTNKDEGIYYAFSNDNYTYYTTSEEPVEGDLLYEKKDGRIKEIFSYTVSYGLPTVLYPVGNDKYKLLYLDPDDNYVASSYDSYTIDKSQDLICWDNTTYTILNNNYKFSYIGEEKTGILVKRTYSYSEHWFDGGSYQIYLPLLFNDYVISGEAGSTFPDSYSITLTKKPEVGDSLEIKYGEDSYAPFICSYSGDILYYKITYVDNYTLVSDTFSKNTTYRGIIYGMIDEYENDCEYDFKNALITGRYSLFDPDLFYYTFTNLGKYYTPLLDSGERVILYPGTYSFLGNIPFRLYEGNSGFNYIKPDVSNDPEYSGWDLYAAICDTEGYIDEDTGERHYKLEMYVLDKKIAHAIKVCEDKQWYTKEVITNDASKNYKIYSKDSDGNIKEYSLIDRSEDTDADYLKDKIIWYLSDDGMQYMPLYRAWIYYSSNQWGQLPYDTYSINLNYKKYSYKSGNDFDVHPTDDTYAHDLILDDYCGANYVISDSYSLGIYFQSLDASYIITWFTLNLNRTNQSNSGNWEFVDYDPNIKFTKPFTITEPMYVYLKSTVLTDSYIDCYVNDVVFSPDIELSTDSDLWCAGHSVGSDLYSASTFGGIVSPRDTSCSYYNADCYRVTLRPGNLKDSRYWIPKVICENVRHSNIKAHKCTLQDCYCVVASNLNYYEYNTNKTFLKNVSFSNLQDVDACKFEDCYTLLVEGTLESTFVNISNTHVFNCYGVNIQSVADSIFENIKVSEICHISQSNLSNIELSSVCSVNTSNILNLYLCYFTNSNSYGNYSNWDLHYKNIYINGLRYKTIDFAELLGEQYTVHQHPGHCVHIRSEDDLTITV